MKHYQCFLRRHSDGGRVLIMKISYIVIGVFGFLVFISFVIACVGIEIQFGKRIEQKGPKMVIPDWIHQKEVEFVSGKNKLKGYIFWNAKDNKLSEKIIVLVHGYGVTYKDYEIEIEEFVKRKYSVFAYDMTGCGMSQGKKIGGFSQFLLDAQSAIKYVESISGFVDVLNWTASWLIYWLVNGRCRYFPIFNAAIVLKLGRFRRQ